MFNKYFLFIGLFVHFSDAFPNEPRMVTTRVTTVTDLKIITATRTYFPVCYTVEDGLPICKARKRSLEEKLSEPAFIRDYSQQIQPTATQHVEITTEVVPERQVPQQNTPQVESSHLEVPAVGVPAPGDLCHGRYFLLTRLSTVTAQSNSTVYVTQTAQNTVTYSLEGCKEPGAIYSPLCDP